MTIRTVKDDTISGICVPVVGRDLVSQEGVDNKIWEATRYYGEAAFHGWVTGGFSFLSDNHLLHMLQVKSQTWS